MAFAAATALMSSGMAKSGQPGEPAVAGGELVDVLIVPRAQPQLDAKQLPATREPRLRAVADALRKSAATAQRGIVAELAARGIPHRSFWVANVVHAQVPAAIVATLRMREDVARILPNPRVRQDFPAPDTTASRSAKAVQANLVAVGADLAWAQGYAGQGIVVAGQDTGYQWDHPALKAKYRGWNGSSVDHAYNWHDAIHGSGTNVCGYSSAAPCDDNGHGTHTMGTVLGDNGAAEQIGMAPAARWIGCRNMDRGIGTPATYIECFQWLMAPTDATGANPDPGRAPHVINNSWACPPSEGCDAEHAALLNQVAANVRAAGILLVVSAGNSGPGCGTIDDAPVTAPASFVVGASANNGAIADFSSRGPVAGQGAGVKPDLVAPGVSIRSSLPATLAQPERYGNSSGTSMSAPHVAGAAALVLSAVPWKAGDVEFLENALRVGAVPRTSAQGCGGFSPTASPNAVYGYGSLDVPRALAAAIDVFSDDFE